MQIRVGLLGLPHSVCMWPDSTLLVSACADRGLNLFGATTSCARLSRSLVPRLTTDMVATRSRRRRRYTRRWRSGDGRVNSMRTEDRERRVTWGRRMQVSSRLAHCWVRRRARRSHCREHLHIARHTALVGLDGHRGEFIAAFKTAFEPRNSRSCGPCDASTA